MSSNHEFELAGQFALHTARHLYLTGRAGSGKTTLLKKIAAQTSKNHVIVAPTGVAAINAGGVTIHSQFNLPLTSFIPTTDYADPHLATNRKGLLSHMKFRREKLKVIQELELLIVDEVSMVRADVLDAVDFVMRTIRRNPKPFGGAQVVLIGDMHQLPPVVKEDEWQVLKQYYHSPYFFDSLVWPQLDAAEVELKKIYRQSDERFLQLLSNIRHRQMEEDDFDELKKLYRPDFRPTDAGYILLTTHNRKADQVNDTALHELPGRLHYFEAEIQGDFPEHIYPCDRVLQLKAGAQVMFTRNDTEGGKYFNGKLAVVKHIEGGNITVTFQDNGGDFQIRREVWENVSYTVDDKGDTVKKTIIGTFSQFPLRLAWAITIHKSQGLTFDKVIIDAGRSFAAGQVYVALSRCRTLEGIVLHSLITPAALHGDEKIAAFSEAHHGQRELAVMLEQAKREYAGMQLQRLFDFARLRDKMSEWNEVLAEKEFAEKAEALKLFDRMSATLESLITTAVKFYPRLEQMIADYNDRPQQLPALLQRCSQAIDYFTQQIFEHLISTLHHHLQVMAYKSKAKSYVRQLQLLQENFWQKVDQLYGAKFMEHPLFAGEVKYRRENLQTTQTSATSGSRQKGGTYRDTLDLHRKGSSIEAIASIRGLAVSTIKGHLARLILSGDVQVHEVLPPENISEMEAYLRAVANPTVGAAMRHFGGRFDGDDIRMVINHIQYSRHN